MTAGSAQFDEADFATGEDVDLDDGGPFLPKPDGAPWVTRLREVDGADALIETGIGDRRLWWRVLGRVWLFGDRLRI